MGTSDLSPTDKAIRQARHDLRGRINAIKLCISAFEVVTTKEDALDFLDMIIQATDKTSIALDTLESAMDRSGPLPP
jgi:hypothetical protein